MGTLRATDLSPEPHGRPLDPLAPGPSALRPSALPILPQDPSRNTNGPRCWVRERGGRVLAWGQALYRNTEEALMESSGKAAGPGLKEEKEFVMWDKILKVIQR